MSSVLNQSRSNLNVGSLTPSRPNSSSAIPPMAQSPTPSSSLAIPTGNGRGGRKGEGAKSPPKMQHFSYSGRYSSHDKF